MTGSIKSLASRLKGYFITGFLAVFPLLLTIFVLKWIAGTIDVYIGPRTLFGQTLQKIGYKFSPISNLTLAYIIGISLFVMAIMILGVLLESGARRTMQEIARRTIYQLPMVRAIYRTTDKFLSLMPGSDVDNIKGMQVVFCRFGEGNNSTGTLALMPSPDIYPLDGKNYRIVIIPTAPIPVGGAMLFMLDECIFPTDMSIDAFAGIYMSMGVTGTPFEAVKKASEIQAPGSGGIAPTAKS
ncbi:MAG: DUF502 domain-containing protein [Planctomycetota bacterium]